MGLAAAGCVLWNRVLKHIPLDPAWPDRDRFVFSAGHASAMLCSLLHLWGCDLPLYDFQKGSCDGRNLRFGVREHAMWARSSPAWPCTKACGPTAGRFSCSPTTCGPPSGWRRSGAARHPPGGRNRNRRGRDRHGLGTLNGRRRGFCRHDGIRGVGPGGSRPGEIRLYA